MQPISMSGGTPFADGEISKQIGRDGESEAVEHLLEGTFQWDSKNKSKLESSKEMHIF